MIPREVQILGHPLRRGSRTLLSGHRFLSTHTSGKPPSFAPRVQINIKSIIEDPDLQAENCISRNYNDLAQYPEKIRAICDISKELSNQTIGLRKEINTIQKQLPNLAERKPSASDSHEEVQEERRTNLIEKARSIRDQLDAFEERRATLREQIQSLAVQLPNLISTETPRGDEPKVLERLASAHGQGVIDSADSNRNHIDIGNDLDLLDFANAGAVSGWGWYFLKNEAALLEHALVSYAIHVARKHGFSVVSPPSMTYAHIAAACGFQPRDKSGEQQIYSIEQPEQVEDTSEKPERVLSGTAEIPLAGMKANHVFKPKDLPLLVVGSSRCYRAEAGARGARTKGLYRVHEFTKVEMFAWTAPDMSLSAFEKMIAVQKEILTSLGLTGRLLEMPTADLGASAFRKQDIEALFPSRFNANIDNGWGEVTSTSMCTDYQSRRLATRVQNSNGPGTQYVHTVNGTAVAIPRILAALLEYGYEKREDVVQIRVPEVLWPWMDGIHCIRRD